MHFDRRDFLKTSAAFAAATGLPQFASAQGAFAPQPGAWRSFQIVTRLEIARVEGKSQAWIPLPSVNEKEWFKTEGNQWTTNGKAVQARDTKYGVEMLHVEWAESEKAPVVEVTSKVFARDRATDLTKPGKMSGDLSAAERKFNTAGNELIPVDGIVKQTSDKIIAGKKTEIEKVHAIYEWVVENTFRDPKTRGCGIGDIAALLKSGNLGGKCADLNALFVGLVRSAGIPAAMFMAFAWHHRSLATKRSAPIPTPSPRRSIAVRKFISRAMAGWRPIRPTCAKSCLRSHLPILRSTIRRSLPRARHCTAPGKATGSPTTSRTTWRCRARKVPNLASSCIRKPRPPAFGLTASIRII